jgi:hypothetical protein
MLIYATISPGVAGTGAFEPTRDLPKWLPRRMCASTMPISAWNKRSVAIKARVQERGGEIKPPTPTWRRNFSARRKPFRQDKSNLLSSETAIYKQVEALFAEIVKQCDEVNAQGHFTVQHQVHVQYRDGNQVCTVGQDSVSMIVIVTTACWANQGEGGTGDTQIVDRWTDFGTCPRRSELRLWLTSVGMLGLRISGSQCKSLKASRDFSTSSATYQSRVRPPTALGLFQRRCAAALTMASQPNPRRNSADFLEKNFRKTGGHVCSPQ